MSDDEIRVPLVLIVPRSTIDEWNEIGGDPLPDEDWINGIIKDDLNSNEWRVERA